MFLSTYFFLDYTPSYSIKTVVEVRSFVHINSMGKAYFFKHCFERGLRLARPFHNFVTAARAHLLYIHEGNNSIKAPAGIALQKRDDIN